MNSLLPIAMMEQEIAKLAMVDNVRVEPGLGEYSVFYDGVYKFPFSESLAALSLDEFQNKICNIIADRGLYKRSFQGANVIDKGPDLGRVCMPLVLLLNEASLSWANRQDIAMAILATRMQWKSLKDEEQHLAQDCAGRKAS